MKLIRYLTIIIFSITATVYAIENPLKEIGINDFSGKKINKNQWFGEIHNVVSGVFAIVTKNDPDKKYKYSIMYVESPLETLKYDKNKNYAPEKVAKEGYYPMPKGLFRATSGLILARKPGTSGEQNDDFYRFDWNERSKEWVEYNIGKITLSSAPQIHIHPSHKIAKSFDSSANLQKKHFYP